MSPSSAPFPPISLFAFRTPKDFPGPGSYCLPASSSLVPGGRFNQSNAKGYLEWIEALGPKLPGPADHPDRSFERAAGGGRFNRSKAKTNLDWVMHYAAQRPGPAE